MNYLERAVQEICVGCNGYLFLPLLNEAGGRNVGGGGSKAVVDAAQHLLGTTSGVLIAY
jgi:hypothetical protein